MEVRKDRVVVLRARREARLIKHFASVDAFVDEVHGDPKVAGISFRLRPVAAVDTPILRRDPCMIVDERRIDGAKEKIGRASCRERVLACV